MGPESTKTPYGQKTQGKERKKRDCKGKTVCWIRMEAGDKGPAGPSGG